MGKSVRSFIPHCLCRSLAGYFQNCLCPTPTPPPSNLTTLLLSEINFGEPLSRGGAPLSKTGVNSESNAHCTERAIEPGYNQHYDAQTDLKPFLSPGPNTGSTDYSEIFNYAKRISPW